MCVCSCTASAVYMYADMCAKCSSAVHVCTYALSVWVAKVYLVCMRIENTRGRRRRGETIECVQFQSSLHQIRIMGEIPKNSSCCSRVIHVQGNAKVFYSIAHQVIAGIQRRVG